VYGAWNGLIFIAWLGFSFALAELLRNDRHRALVVSVAFLIGGLILVGEAFSRGLDVGAVIALVAGVFLAGMGALLLVRIGRRSG
jgi:hypothetical protein